MAQHGSASTRQVPRAVSGLDAGDHLDQPTFHALYSRMPEKQKAELIGGVVIMPSPLRFDHGEYHSLVMGWLTSYRVQTPGTRVADNTTTILGADSEPHPDAVLILDPEVGGHTRFSADGYMTGPPELVVEIASSTAAYDLYEKRHDYERAGVLEYVVVVVAEQRIFWWRLVDGCFIDVAPDAQGVYRSSTFPGLWLDGRALARLDGKGLFRTLRRGLDDERHGAFANQLQQRLSRD